METSTIAILHRTYRNHASSSDASTSALMACHDWTLGPSQHSANLPECSEDVCTFSGQSRINRSKERETCTTLLLVQWRTFWYKGFRREAMFYIEGQLSTQVYVNQWKVRSISLSCYQLSDAYAIVAQRGYSRRQESCLSLGSCV